MVFIIFLSDIAAEHFKEFLYHSNATFEVVELVKKNSRVRELFGKDIIVVYGRNRMVKYPAVMDEENEDVRNARLSLRGRSSTSPSYPIYGRVRFSYSGFELLNSRVEVNTGEVIKVF